MSKEEMIEKLRDLYQNFPRPAIINLGAAFVIDDLEKQITIAHLFGVLQGLTKSAEEIDEWLEALKYINNIK